MWCVSTPSASNFGSAVTLPPLAVTLSRPVNSKVQGMAPYLSDSTGRPTGLSQGSTWFFFSTNSRPVSRETVTQKCTV